MNIKQWMVSSLVLLFGFSSAYAAKIEESLFVLSNDVNLVKLLGSRPELTLDHPSSEGFEVYGPKGTSEWLDNMNIKYLNMKEFESTKDDNFDTLNYPTHAELTAVLKKLANDYPKILKLFSIGKSSQGLELWVMKISDNVELDEKEPEFKYISSMHGDEITGRELTTFLIADIAKAYGRDQAITDLVNNTEIFIMPSMNPDGSRLRQRANGNGYDLNRNFPDWTRGDSNTSEGRQVETVAVMNFQASRHFSLSANFHGGAVVVNYPWDSSYDLHPLDEAVQKLSLSYADLNPAMRNSRDFDRGITNGADWYVLRGGMQDWSYYWYNDLQVTIELSNRKWPNYSDIAGFYRDNKDSMLAYIKKVHQGAGVRFETEKSGSVKVVQIGENSERRELGTYGFFGGEFYKVLEQGDYVFQVKTTDQAYEVEVSVSDDMKTNGNFIEL